MAKPTLHFEGAAAGGLLVRRFQLMPVLMATQFGADNSYITKSAAMLPDALIPLQEAETPQFRCIARQWDGFWCDWQIGTDTPAGEPFLVYPAADGTAWESIRGMVLREAFQSIGCCAWRRPNLAGKLC